MGKGTLRSTGDPLGHRNKGERTINEPGHLLEIIESGNSPRDTECLPGTSWEVKEYFQFSVPCFPPSPPKGVPAGGREISGRE